MRIKEPDPEHEAVAAELRVHGEGMLQAQSKTVLSCLLSLQSFRPSQGDAHQLNVRTGPAVL